MNALLFNPAACGTHTFTCQEIRTMKKVIILVAALSVVWIGCKRDSDVLATYNNGQVTRGEFHTWLDAHHISKDAVLKKKKQQVSKLTTMVQWKLAADEARKAGFDKSEDFKTMADIATESQLISIVFKKEVQDKSTFEEPAVKLRQIVLNVKNFNMVNNKRVNLEGAALEAEFAKATAQANEIIGKLNAGGDFEDLAKKHSQDFTKNKGGDAGYIIKQMVQPELAKAAFSLKEGEYSREPIRLQNSVVIVKVEDITKLTPDNIEDVIGNKVQATRLKNRLVRDSGENFLAGLKAAPDVTVSLENVASRDKKAVLFKVADTTYTVADLDARIDLITKRIYKDAPQKNKINDEQKKRLADSMLRYVLLNRVAQQKGIVNDPEYIKNVELRKESLLAREYMRQLSTSSIKITDAEIRDEYTQNKDKRYYTVSKVGGKNQKVPQPYTQARERIEKMLTVKKQSTIMNEWKEKVMGENNFKVIESELEGD